MISTRGALSAIMKATRSRGYDGSIGTYAAPAFSTPSIAATASRSRSSSRPTNSLRPTPIQAMRDAIGARVQFAVRDARGAVDRCHPRRIRSGLRLEQLVNRAVDRKVGTRGVEVLEQCPAAAVA